MDTATEPASRLQELVDAADDLSLALVADRLGVGEVQVKRWAANKVLIPTKHLAVLTELFDCTVEHLMGWDREPARTGKAAA